MDPIVVAGVITGFTGIIGVLIRNNSMTKESKRILTGNGKGNATEMLEKMLAYQEQDQNWKAAHGIRHELLEAEVVRLQRRH